MGGLVGERAGGRMRGKSGCVSVYVCVCVFVSVCLCVSFVCACLCVCVWMCVCLCVNMCVLVRERACRYIALAMQLDLVKTLGNLIS